MKRMVLVVLAAFSLSLPFTDSASAHGPKKRPRARDSACRELHGALFGLCRAYCDALHCADNGERRACELLRHLYERVSNGVPPPCEEEPAACGDGAVNQADEQCDDGNGDSCDGCSATCQVESCGDGSVCPGEQCDDGNGDSCDGCSATCQVESCGDGNTCPAEECDDGNNDPCDGCSATCTVEGCGDGTVCPDEECEPGDTCGDGQSCTDDCMCPLPPPPPVFCGESAAPECGGECPPDLTCTDLGILPFCECFAL